MNKCMLACFIFTTCMLYEAVAHFHDKFLDDSDHEMISRIPRGIHGKRKDGECRYKKGLWSDCDATSNMQRKTLSLKKGDASCEQTKVITRKCKKACKYEKGEWSDCDIGSNSRSRTDTVKPESDSSCPPTREISKKCKKVCKYNKQAQWSECDLSTGKKMKVLVLKSSSSQGCEPSKKITKPCHKGSNHGNHKGGNKDRQIDDDGDYEDDD
ncbi:pleiotrophin-like isoform X2 [Uloborus diversus]|uniref:pleiotrophin-like isoform X2 n=1 Tax=Uloborus diversus TaxID=327109 RepID=UPI002409F701|nr:pleiotrophin-like isoform X2 [Uloborus diversus]